MQVRDFLNIYTKIAKQQATEQEIDILYKDLIPRAKNTSLEAFFESEEPYITKVIAIDAVAHEIHSVNPHAVYILFPDEIVNMQEVKEALDSLSLMEVENDVRKANRGFFTTILSEDFQIISKQVGKTTTSDISDAINEYKVLFDAEQELKGATKLISNAELLTLYRYNKNKGYLTEIKKRNLLGHDPLVVAGYASVEISDKEGHLVTTSGLKNAFDKFMKSFRTRNNMIAHSNIQCGWCLPAYINSKNEVFKSGVDKKGLFVISEIRGDDTISQRVAKEIEAGNIKSYSIAGSVTKKQFRNQGPKLIMQVDELDLSEITFCEKPVNPEANFQIIKSQDLNRSVSSGTENENISLDGGILLKDENKGPDLKCSDSEIALAQVSEDTKVLMKDVEGAFSVPLRISDVSVALVGGIVRDGESEHDIDILIRASKDSFLGRAARLRISRMLRKSRPELIDKIRFIYEPEGPHGSFIPLYFLQLCPIETLDIIELSQDDLINTDIKQKTAEQRVALRSLGEYEVTHEHDDGDLTVESGGNLYVVTTDGKIFKEISSGVMKTYSDRRRLAAAGDKRIAITNKSRTQDFFDWMYKLP